MEKVLITVIIPIYNVEKYLEKCVNSVLAQSYKNLEIILVDDGATDNCPAICDEYSKIDNRIKVIHKANGGLSSARNAGLDNMSGEFVTFVDSDDYIDKDFISILYSLMIDKSCDLAICRYINVNEEGKLISNQTYIENSIRVIEKKDIFNEFILNASFCVVTACVKLYDKKIFDDLRFDVGKINEDEFIYHKVLAKASRIVMVDKPLYFYLIREGSIVNRNKSIKNFDCIEAFILRAKYFKDINSPLICSKTLNKLTLYFINLINEIGFNDKRVKTKVKELLSLYKKCFGISLHYFFMKACFFCRKIGIKVDLQKIINGRLRSLLTSKTWKKQIAEQVKRIKRRNSEVCWIPFTVEHGNLGDQAIVCAMEQFIKDKCSKYTLIEIQDSDFQKYKFAFKSIVSKKDIICMPGGGSVGTLWQNEENKMRWLLKNFKHNKVIIFPQSVYFENSPNGNKELAITRKIYQSHKHFTFFARDKKSYDIISLNKMAKDIRLCPDIVFYIGDKHNGQKIDKIGVCFRKDLESMQGQDLILNIEKYIGQDKLMHTDTVIPYMISSDVERVNRLQEKFDEFSKYRLIVTNRMHGMIFSAITGTPCIAFDNISMKVSGQYEWIKNLPYVKIVETYDEFVIAYDELDNNCKENIFHFDNSLYADIIKVINE